jgi:hypothetical protein
MGDQPPRPKSTRRRSARAGGAVRAVKAAGGRARSLYNRRQLAIMLVAILIGFGAVWHADRLLTVHDPPPVTTEPVLAVLVDPFRRLGWVDRVEYEVVQTFSGCENPVTVEFSALVRGGHVAGPSMAREGYAHGAVVDPLRAVRSLTMLQNPTATFPPTWVKPKGLEQRRDGDRFLFGAPLRTWYPASVMVGMAAASSVRAVLVRVRFEADWVLPRSTGTCFVRFPTLQAPTVDPLREPSTASAGAPAPGPGKVNVVSTGGETVDAQASIPPPTDPRIPQWRCASTAVAITQRMDPMGGAANCGGVAIFSEPGADANVALWLLIDGALIGLAAALLAESAIGFDLRGRRGRRGRTPA